MAAQKQAIEANVVKAKIDKTQAESKCRLCGKVGETVRSWHKGSIKGDMTGWAERYIGKYVESWF